MNALTSAEQAVRAGEVSEALKYLQDAIRAKPEDAKLRVFLFQLLCVRGQWERALNQLEVASRLDASTLAMAQTYREAIWCERLRAQVFEGLKAPMVFGEPEQWLAFMIESLLLRRAGNFSQATELRNRAFEEAPPTSGTLNSEPFAWIADADMRLGPVLEAVINGRYYWVPMDRLARASFEAPEDLRDLVWMPAHLLLENGGEVHALVPTRYAGTEKSDDALLLLSRKTEWLEVEPQVFHGTGQRVLTSDTGEISLLDVREITFQSSVSTQPQESAA